MQHTLGRNLQYAILLSCCVLFLMLSACSPSVTSTPFIAPHSEKIIPTDGRVTQGTSSVETTPSLLEKELTQQAISTTPTFTEPDTFTTPAPTFTLLPIQEPTLSDSNMETPGATTNTCVDSLRYLQDANFPDGSNVTPGQVIEKQWLVENNGTCDWNEMYRIKLVTGFPSLGAPSDLALVPTHAGEQAYISISFSAPFETGIFRTTWQAYNSEGVAFGEAIYMEVIVIQ